MKTDRKNILFLISVLFLIFVFSTAAIWARAFRLDFLPDKGKNFGCKTCHINPNGGGAKNPFGSDYERIAIPAGDKYTDVLAKIDSDGDGWTNEQEFSANPVTNPGDANSRPPQTPKLIVSQGKKYISWGAIKK